MGTVVNLPGQTHTNNAGAAAFVGHDEETLSDAMSDLIQKCALLIGSAIYDRIRELGGTEHDVRQVARSAAYAVFVSAAGDAFGD